MLLKLPVDMRKEDLPKKLELNKEYLINKKTYKLVKKNNKLNTAEIINKEKSNSAFLREIEFYYALEMEI